MIPIPVKAPTGCRIVPYALFSDPELGRTSMSEAEARRPGQRIKGGLRDLWQSAKAGELGKDRGFIKVVLDAWVDATFGAAAFCERGSEVVQLFFELSHAASARASSCRRCTST